MYGNIGSGSDRIRGNACYSTDKAASRSIDNDEVEMDVRGNNMDKLDCRSLTGGLFMTHPSLPLLEDGLQGSNKRRSRCL